MGSPCYSAHRMKILRHIIIIALAGILLAAQTAYARTVDWRVTRAEHFIIYYASRHEQIAGRAKSIAEKSYAHLSRKLGFAPGGIIPIYLYPDRISFSEAEGIDSTDSIVGTAQTRTLRIKIDASGTFADIKGVIPHELVHVFIFRKLHGNSTTLPMWMHEGLAKYFAEDWTGADAELLADAASGGGVLPLTEITDSFPADKRKRSIAYVQSYSAVKHMVDRYGPETVTNLLTEIEHYRSFRTAMLYSVGLYPDKFEEDWRQYLWEEYGLSRWLRFASAVLSAAMAIFAILAFRARRIRKRQKEEEFEAEDFDEDVEDLGTERLGD